MAARTEHSPIPHVEGVGGISTSDGGQLCCDTGITRKLRNSAIACGAYLRPAFSVYQMKIDTAAHAGSAGLVGENSATS